MKLYMFPTVHLSIIRIYSQYTQQWCMSYSFVDSFRAGLGSSSNLFLLESCLQTCLTHTIAECTVNNSWWWTEELSETCRVSFPKKNFEKLVHLVFLFVCFSGRPRQCTAACWLILPPTLDLTTLATRCPRAYRRVPHSSGGSWILWAVDNDRLFCLSADFHGTLRDLSRAANLRHGTHGFTSLPKEGVLRIFPPLKIRRLRPGLNPRTWGTRGQHAKP
jgi:hypothetical protein